MLSVLVKLLVAAFLTACAALETPDDLHNQYYVIFPNGNRNAASHRWATYVLEHSADMTDSTLRTLFSSFCPVSGSPVSASPQKRWKMMLPLLGKDQGISGMLYFCCSPCVCDTQEFIKVDTKTITTKDGPKQYYFTVIGNPCLHPEALEQQWQDPFDGAMVTLQQKAPDVKCSGDELEKATLSDHGHIIIGMFFESGTPGHATSDDVFNDGSSKEAKDYCEKRAANGYNSGMGEIFRKVALITPLNESSKSSNSSNFMEATSVSSGDSSGDSVSSEDSSGDSMKTSSGSKIAGSPMTFTCLFVAMLFRYGRYLFK
jgi:hypothetical protein